MLEDRPVSVVVADIFDNVQDMVRSEIRLASAEIKIEAVKAVQSGALLASGAALGLYAFGLLIAVVVLLLSRLMDLWLAALVVCLVVSGAAATAIALGRHRWKQLHLTPDKTVQTMKENVSWMSAQIK